MMGRDTAINFNIGDDYVVPCVRVNGLEWIAEDEWLPVIGPYMQVMVKITNYLV